MDACFPVVSFLVFSCQEIEQLRMALKREIMMIEVPAGFSLPKLSQPICRKILNADASKLEYVYSNQNDFIKILNKLANLFYLWGSF